MLLTVRRAFGLVFAFATLVLPASAQDADVWSPVPVDGDAHARHENAFVEAGGKYYLIGGRGLKPVDIYDPATQAWSQGATPPIELHHFQAVEHDGLIYVVGALTGRFPHEIPAPHIYLYDPVQGRWIVGPEIPADRRRGAAGVAVHDGRLYLVAGIVDGHRSGWVPWVDAFDPATNTWERLPDAPRARDHFQAAVIDGKLYAAGGRRTGSAETPFGGTVTAVDVFDLDAQTWTTLPSSADLPTPRAGTAVAVWDDELVVMGGESASQEPAHDEVEALDTRANTWRAAPPLHTGRHGTQAVVTPQGTFVAGGCAQRGGRPELTALEVLADDGASGSAAEPLEAGSLELAAVEPLGDGSLRVRVRNARGNQALVLTYALATGAADVQKPADLPLALAPDAEATFTVTSGAADEPGTLLIKAYNTDAPLEVSLAGRSGSAQ